MRSSPPRNPGAPTIAMAPNIWLGVTARQLRELAEAGHRRSNLGGFRRKALPRCPAMRAAAS